MVRTTEAIPRRDGWHFIDYRKNVYHYPRLREQKFSLPILPGCPVSNGSATPYILRLVDTVSSRAAQNILVNRYVRGDTNMSGMWQVRRQARERWLEQVEV